MDKSLNLMDKTTICNFFVSNRLQLKQTFVLIIMNLDYINNTVINDLV